jgi:CheY-like chemotaxis protein
VSIRRTGVSHSIGYFFQSGFSFMGTLLIVENDTTTRNALAELLAREGREIVTAADGQQALERLSTGPPPSLILLDLSMPRMNGFEFLRRQSTNPLIAGIPTMVVSGSSSDLPPGARQLMTKPVNVSRLMALVDQYC